MNRILVLGVSLIALVASADAGAWGKTGHRVTGQIAERYLSDAARAEVRRILGVEDLAESSTWPDFMRSDPSPFWQRESSPFHYVTVPPGKTYAEVGAPPQGDAVTALARFRATLEDPDAKIADQQLALRFIVHLVSDLHQPLHAGNGSDRGGNDFTVVFYGDVTNLHSVWDSGLVDEEQLSYTEYSDWLLRRITDAQALGWMQTDPEVWIAESVAIRDRIYPAAGASLRQYRADVATPARGLGVKSRRAGSRCALEVREHVGPRRCHRALADIQQPVPDLGYAERMSPHAHQLDTDVIGQDGVGHEFQRYRVGFEIVERILRQGYRVHVGRQYAVRLGKGHRLAVGAVRAPETRHLRAEEPGVERFLSADHADVPVEVRTDFL